MSDRVRVQLLGSFDGIASREQDITPGDVFTRVPSARRSRKAVRRWTKAKIRDASPVRGVVYRATIRSPVVRDLIVLESSGGQLAICLEKLGFVPLLISFVDLAALTPAQ